MHTNLREREERRIIRCKPRSIDGLFGTSKATSAGLGKDPQLTQWESFKGSGWLTNAARRAKVLESIVLLGESGLRRSIQVA